MPLVFVVEVEECGGERRWTRAEVAEDCDLGELHGWIAGAFGLEVETSHGFTRAGRRPGETRTVEGRGGEHLLAAEEVELGLEAEVGEILVARLLAVDGVVAPGAGLVSLSSDVVEGFVPRVRRAFVELRAAGPDTAWGVFRKRPACELCRELIGTIHDGRTTTCTPPAQPSLPAEFAILSA